MKVTAAASRRSTNNQRLFLFHARAAAPRSLRVRIILVHCADFRCSHCVAISGDGWQDDVRQSDSQAAVCVPPRVKIGLGALIGWGRLRGSQSEPSFEGAAGQFAQKQFVPRESIARL